MGKIAPNGFLKLFPTEKKLPDVTNPVYINNLFHIWNRDEDIKETVKPTVFVTSKKANMSKTNY